MDRSVQQQGSPMSCMSQGSEACSPVGKVGGLVAEDLEADGVTVQAVLSQDLDGPIQARLRRLVVMKQVSSQEDKVNLHLLCNLEDLLKSDKGVVLPHLVLLPDTLQVHRIAVSAAAAGCGLRLLKATHIAPGGCLWR